MFNLFKNSKKNEAESPAKENHTQALHLFNEQKYADALRQLTAGFRADIYYKPLYVLAAQCLEQLGGKEEALLFKAAEKNLGFDSFKKLGIHFYNVDHYPMSIIFLEEANSKKIDPQIANNLAVAYARKFQTKKAQETLERISNNFDFWSFWFYVKTKILNNDKKDLAAMVNELKSAIDPNDPNEQLKIPRQKIKEIEESYNRLLSLESPQELIRDWHYIQYGGVILDFFFDENQYIAGGRYVATWSSHMSIKTNLLRLQNVLLEKDIQQVVYGTDRDSTIIGLALAKVLDLPSKPYESNTLYHKSIFCVADGPHFEPIQGVEEVKNGNITFSYNLNWLQANFICPDIIAMLSQYNNYPWNGGNITMNEDGTQGRSQADLRSPEEIASDIANTETDRKYSFDPFYTTHMDHLKLNQTEGHRYNFMLESPVPGSYFGA